jgi:hypothetical protein
MPDKRTCPVNGRLAICLMRSIIYEEAGPVSSVNLLHIQDTPIIKKTCTQTATESVLYRGL